MPLRLALVIVVLFNTASCESVSAVYSNKQKIVVYNNNQAQIEKEYVVKDNLSVGRHTITIKGLLSGVNDESLFLKGNAEILDFKIVQTFSKVEPSLDYTAKIEQLTASMEKLLSTQRELLYGAKRYQDKQDSVKRFAENSLAVGTGQSRPTIEEASAIIQYQDAEMEKIDRAMLEIDAKKSTVASDIVVLQRQINDLKAAIAATSANLQQVSVSSSSSSRNIKQQQQQQRDREDHGIVVPPEVISIVEEKSVEFQIDLKKASSAVSPLVFSTSYLTQPASWSPDYDIKVDDFIGDGRSSSSSSMATKGTSLYSLRLDYYANVWQQTTEDWTDTTLSLATSSPSYFNRPAMPNKKGVYFNSPRAFTRSFNGIATSAAAPQMKMARAQSFMAMDRAEGGDMEMMEDGAMASQAEPMMMMEDMHISATGSSVGDLGSAHLFTINYPVNISSSHYKKEINQGVTTRNVKKHRLLLDSISIDAAHVFTFAVPSQDTQPWLQSWVQYPATATSPLLAAYNSRVLLHGMYAGTTAVESTQPGGKLKLSLGPDRNIQIKTSTVIPTHKGKEEDKSTWFVTDKRKFRLRTEERITTIASTYPAIDSAAATSRAQLVIVSENLPRSTEEGEITVELMVPESKQFASLSSVIGDEAADEEFLSAVLEAEKVAHLDTTVQLPSSGYRTYFNKFSGNIYWAAWVTPGQAVSAPFKYKIMWPDEKSAVVY